MLWQQARTTTATFVDAAMSLCAAAAELDTRAAVMLHLERGPTGIAVDNMPGVTDDMRRWGISDEAWLVNPVMIELRRNLAVLGPEAINVDAFFEAAAARGYSGLERTPMAVPLLAPTGWFGTVVYAAAAAPSVAVEQQLILLATELSVWCTDRGISTLPDVRPLARRQHEVAMLAANGRTNPEIADTLGISVNTVKLRLKQGYERLGVDSRTALSSMLRRLAPLEGVPPGITHRGPFAVTRRP